MKFLLLDKCGKVCYNNKAVGRENDRKKNTKKNFQKKFEKRLDK